MPLKHQKYRLKVKIHLGKIANIESTNNEDQLYFRSYDFLKVNLRDNVCVSSNLPGMDSEGTASKRPTGKETEH